MKRYMNRNMKKWAILATLIAVALLATFWASQRLRPHMERLEWGRWNLTDDQRTEIEQLIKDMREAGASRKEIRAAIDTKLGELGIKPSPPGDIELFYTVKTVVSSINVTLVICLLITYIGIYRKTKSEFTIGLIIFSMVFLFYALAANPIMHRFLVSVLSVLDRLPCCQTYLHA